MRTVKYKEFGEGAGFAQWVLISSVDNPNVLSDWASRKEGRLDATSWPDFQAVFCSLKLSHGLW